MIDTHAHIYAKEFDPDRSELIQRAVSLGVTKIYMPNIDHSSVEGMLDAELKYPGLAMPMIGLHPCSVKKDFEKELLLVEQWLEKRTFAAIGEMGTDLFWDKTFWKEQKEAFRIQVEFAKKYKLPIVIHCRESMDQTMELLEPLISDGLTGIFHCFSGNSEQAKKIISMGFYLGLGGVSTFKNGGLDKVIPELDMDRIVLETDSPYLAPVPHRGKRNEPSYLLLIAEKIAALKGIPVQTVIESTTLNTKTIFRG